MVEGINQFLNDPETASNYKPVQVNYNTLSTFERRYGYNLAKDVTDGNISAVNNPTNKELTVFSINNFEAIKNVVESMFDFFKAPIDAEVVLYKDSGNANAIPYKVIHPSTSQPISSLQNDSYIDANGNINIDSIYSHVHDEDYFRGDTDNPGSVELIENLLSNIIDVKEYLFTDTNDSEGLNAYEDVVRAYSSVNNPLEHIIDLPTLNYQLDDNNIDISGQLDSAEFNDIISSINISTYDENVVREIVALILKDDIDKPYVTRIEVNDYVDRKWVLIGYIIISLGLLSLAYLAIRRRDFR